ncbi:Major Facilitator Superfamily (MFS), partial [Pseudoloma neurophilia]
MTEVQITNKNSTEKKQVAKFTTPYVLGLVVSYCLAFLFGYHLSSFDIINELYFRNNESREQKAHYDYLSALPFAIPIIVCLVKPFIPLDIPKWYCVLFASHSISFICYIRKNTPLFYIGRFFTGVSLGITPTVVCEYLGKLDQENGGLLICFFQTVLVFGIFVGQISCKLIKTVMFSKILFFILSIVCCFFICFSKYIYNIIIVKSKIIQKTEQTDGTINNQADDTSNNQTDEKTLKEYFQENDAYLTFAYACVVHFAQQMSCINAITVFSNDLLYQIDGKPGQ